MTTLVTGGTGFLGRWIVQKLRERGESVRVLCRAYDADLDELGVEIVEGSVTNRKDLEKACDGVKHVYHLAGRVERDRREAHKMYALHVDGTRALLETLAESRPEKIVIASTSGTVGVSEDSEWIATDDAPYADQVVKGWPYYLSKIYAERVADELAARHDLPIVQMRPTLLLGPGDRRESSTGDVVLFMRRKIPTLVPGGLSFVDVRDTADAFIAAMDRAKPGEKYLLGAANLTIADFFAELERLTGVAAPTVQIPHSAAVLSARVIATMSRFAGTDTDLDPASVEMARHYWYIDSTRAQRDLGFEPRPASETLRDTVSWIRKNHPDFASKRKTPPAEWVRPETLAHGKNRD